MFIRQTMIDIFSYTLNSWVQFHSKRDFLEAEVICIICPSCLTTKLYLSQTYRRPYGSHNQWENIHKNFPIMYFSHIFYNVLWVSLLLCKNNVDTWIIHVVHTWVVEVFERFWWVLGRRSGVVGFSVGIFTNKDSYLRKKRSTWISPISDSISLSATWTIWTVRQWNLNTKEQSLNIHSK